MSAFVGLAVATSVALPALVVYWLVSDKTAVLTLLELWGVGTVFYALLAMLLFFLGLPPSPLLRGLAQSDAILYYLAYPIRLLAVFSVGLAFVRMTSPVELLRFGRFGFWAAVLLRIAQVTMQVFSDVTTALLVQGDWPDADDRANIWRNNVERLKAGPSVVSTAIRILLVWGPGAWLTFRTLLPRTQRRSM